MTNSKYSLRIRKMVYAAICLALALVLPFLTGQIPQLGKMLCPMHIPALLCGFICGPVWGMLVGFVAPVLRSLIFGAPVMFPTAISMAFELLTYGLISGIFYLRFPKKNVYIYITLIISMIAGRIVAGISMYLLLATKGQTYALSTFISVNFVTAIPAIILQLVLIPVLVMALRKTLR